MKKIHPALITALLLCTLTALLGAQETREQRDRRMAWWREARFGMFIHWGLYAIPAGVWKGEKVKGIGEWIMYHGQIPVKDYEPLAKKFNPVKFDAGAWARLAKSAGMKYVVITTKHHDGFCLFDTKLTDYDVMDASPFKRDIMKELSDACRREGLHMCWYHSILDWRHPDYLPRGPGSRRPWDTRPVKGADYNRYIDYMKGQLRELLTNYGKIGVLWFDGGWEHKPEDHRAAEVVRFIKDLQPEIIINNRLKIPQDFDTPEQYIPPTGIPDRDWETCMTMNRTWGFKSYDQDWKFVKDLVQKLIDVASKGGNFLLNVGPTAEGLIPEASQQRLAAMGQWLEKNGEAIHGTTASPFRRLDWGRCTRKAEKLYLHVWNWPEGDLSVPGLKNEIKRAYLLRDPGQDLLHDNSSEGVIVNLGGLDPDPLATVVVLEIKGPPDVENRLPSQGADGTVLLPAREALVHGRNIRYESGGGKDNIGYWTRLRDWVSWEFKVVRPGAFEVTLEYACPESSAGSEFTLAAGKTKLAGKVKATGSWDRYRTEVLGRVELAEPGTHVLTLRPRTKPGHAVMNLKSVRLKTG